MENSHPHKTVLLKEAVDALALTGSSVVVDATGGAGGHSERILETLTKEGVLIVIDSDPHAIEHIKHRIGDNAAKIHFRCGNFRAIDRIVTELGIEKVDAVLADLGWNSAQFETGEKGFSFLRDEPLLMTYGESSAYSFTAKDIVNEWREEAIADLIYAYADEHFARRIAKKIVETRKVKPLETTRDLIACVLEAVPKKFHHGRIHPATKTFQALRIAVNDELDAVTELIEGSLNILQTHGRLSIITFHSIEDRIVKNTFKDNAEKGRGIVLTKKPIIATQEELKENPRARSAKLRIFETL